jgi:hypothetical protein
MSTEQNQRLQRFRSGEDLAVDISAIEKELTSLWKAASDDKQQSTTRACLWNLAVYSTGYEQSDQLRNQLETIYPSLPMRTLILEVEPDVEPPLSAWVSARCHITGGKQVCSEEVTIRSDHRAVTRLSPLLSALLVPDIPSAAWWPDLSQEPDALFGHFIDHMDRVVLDSSGVPGEQGLKTLQRLSQLRRASRRLLGDLAWHRIAPWRSLIARLFDTPAARLDLPLIDAIEVDSTGRPGDPTGSPALLLTGWLAERLRWTPDGDRWRRTDGAHVSLQVQQRRGKRRNDLQAITLRAQDRAYTVTLHDDGLLRAHATHLGDGVAAILRLHARSDAELLRRELGPMGDDPLLWGAIDHAL